MSNHNHGFVLTAKAAAFLKCNPILAARRCGACGRERRSCTRSPCPTRMDGEG